MKIAILSDIHSNYYALEAVLKHSQRHDVERYWVLGDIVGYGPHPEKCLEWFKNEYHRIDWVLGNHDAMLRGVFAKEQINLLKENSIDFRNEYKFALKELADVESFSQQPDQSASVNGAAIAIRLNLKMLEKSPDLDDFWKRVFSREHLGPKKVFIESKSEYWIVHASRKEPLGKYIYPWTSFFLKYELQYLVDVVQSPDMHICQWHGHSHVPYILTLDKMDVNGEWSPTCVSAGQTYSLGKAITIANPGSVGQPRNGDRRACYAVLDTNQNTTTFYRVDYEWSKTAGDMQRGGYGRLIERLKTAGYPTDYPPDQTWIDYMKLQEKESSK
jgi:predicted phosphodiesterase